LVLLSDKDAVAVELDGVVRAGVAASVSRSSLSV
jgi:hypothetical protein